MEKKVAEVVTLLLISMLMLAFSPQPSEAEPKPPLSRASAKSWQSPQSVKAKLQGKLEAENEKTARASASRKLDLAEDRDLNPFDWSCKETGNLILGVDVSKQRIQGLEKIISNEGGKVTDTISIGENVRALTVEVPTHYAHIFAEKLQANELIEYVELNSKAKAFYTPNDPYWSYQWGPKKIEADSAWDMTIGSSDILIAIIDTGIDYTHSDLAANYVPLGYDWVNDDSDPMDDNGHGTHCAGLAAAKLNNSVGIAGLAQVRIIAEKVLDRNAEGYYSWITQGIYHAIDNGAKIISMSLGGYADSQPLHDAVEYAYDHGVLVIAAAGNDGNEVKWYPAAYDEVVAVSATDSLDNLATFSTYGPWIDLSAPGVDIYSTVLSNAYMYYSGTSMACPHVTGVAALAWSVFKNSTIGQIRRLLLRTADDLGEVGFDKYFGYGRVNARRAVVGLPEHDICITGWQHPNRLNPGQVGVFNVTISNYGENNETNISVKFFVNETLIDCKIIDFLEVDASTPVSFWWGTTTIGSYNVTCYAVPVTGENLTENNVVSSDVLVRFPTIWRVPDDFSTIKAAVNNAGEGDMILVGEGYYAEGQIDIFKNNITLVADGHVILEGRREGCVLNIKADHIVIEGFDIRNSTDYGVKMKGYGNTLTKNTIVNYKGVLLYNSLNSVISLNNVTSGSYGIFVDHSTNNTVSQNRLVSSSASGEGIHIYWSSNNTVSLNTVTEGTKRFGFVLQYSQNNFVASNNVTKSNYGLVLLASPYNVLRNNILADNLRNFCVWKEDVLVHAWQTVNDIDDSNTVDGKPIYYWVNVRDRSVPLDAGCVVLVYCENIKVENLNLQNNLDGVLLVETHGIQISRNNITANTGYPWELTCGGIVALFGSSNNTISRNNITFNEYGILFCGGFNNTVSLNNIASNYMWGVELFSSSSTVSSNNLTNNGSGAYIHGSNDIINLNNIVGNEKYGIYIEYSANHTVSSNNIVAANNGLVLVHASDGIVGSNNAIECGDYVIWMYQALNNVFFHNNFINNTKQVYSFESANVWDNGYPSGGNYWSNYNGTDLYSGPYQNVTGSDGIGDTPYVIDANNQDNYPLMKPYGGLYDIGIIDIITSKTVVGQGYNLNVTVKMLNYGINTETFNVTAYANTTLIQTKTITLISRNSTTVTFSWNTTGVAKGNYTITAEATQLPDETDTTDNTYIDGIVTVALVGDINADGIVELSDLYAIALAYGKSVGEPGYDPNLDVNSDGIIDISDLYLVAIHYGETDP